MTKLSEKDLTFILLKIDDTNEELATRFNCSVEYIRTVRTGKSKTISNILKNLDDFERSLVTWRNNREKFVNKSITRYDHSDEKKNSLQLEYESKNPRPI